MEEDFSREEATGAGFLDRGEDSVVAGEPLRHPWPGRPQFTSGREALPAGVDERDVCSHDAVYQAWRLPWNYGGGSRRSDDLSAAWANRARAKR